MIWLAFIVLATLLAARSALRSGSTAALGLTSFALGAVLWFRLLVQWAGGVEMVFSGASLEFFGVLVLLVASLAAAAVTSLAATVLVGRLASARRPSP